MKRGLVISGGGSTGAFAGGILEYLIKEKGLEWDIVVGTSTGSLLVPLASINKIDELKDAYTNVTNGDIFTISPYNKRNKFRIFNILKRLIMGKTSVGDASKLRKKIMSIFTEDDYNKTIKMEKYVYVSTTNMTKSKVEYKCQRSENYNDFCDWMFASASFPVLFDIVKKNGYEYLDGGIIEPIPLQKAVDEECDIIDVIILSAEQINDNPPSDNMFDVAINTLKIMREEINSDDLEIGKLNGEIMNIKINIYRLPKDLTNNCILFNKEEMIKWWKDGYEFAKHHVRTIELQNSKKSKNYKIINDNKI